MGAANTKAEDNIPLSINHPKFSNVKAIKNEEKIELQITQGSDEKAYETWKKLLTNSNVKSPYLFIPISHNFTSKGFCGSTGLTTVKQC